MRWTQNKVRVLKSGVQFYTRPKIDVNWCISYPERFLEFVNSFKSLDLDFEYNLPIIKRFRDLFPVIIFEIESSIDKHTGRGF